MPKQQTSQTGSLWNKSILISTAVILTFLVLPCIFTMTSAALPDPQAQEEIGLVKTASDLLSPKIWWPVLLSSLLFFGLALYSSIRSSSPGSENRLELSLGTTVKRLGILAVLSLAAYIFFFLFPFPLHRYYDLKRVSMGWIADRNWVAALTLAFAIVALFLLYLSAYRLVLQQNARQLRTIVLLGALFFGLINLFVFPISSTDLYDYVSRGRISGVHGGNPLLEIPDDYPDDAYVQLAAWRKDPSAYGPLWEVLSGFIGRYSGGRLWNDILGYKGLALVSYLLSTVAIASILQRVAPNRSLSGTLLFAWNPLVLLEGVANAHNDMLMVALLLGGFWILSQAPMASSSNKNHKENSGKLVYGVLALLFLALAVLVKFIPILLLPPFLLYLKKQEKSQNRGLRNIVLYLLPLAFIFFIYYRVFWDWPEITSSILQRTGMFRMSLASATKLMLVKFIEGAWAEGIASSLFLGAFGVGYLIILLRLAAKLGISSRWIDPVGRQTKIGLGRLKSWIIQIQKDSREIKAWDLLISTCLKILLLYLLLGSLWFWPWYLIWPMALLPFLEDDRLITILLVVGCAGQLSYILWNFVWYWLGIEWETLYVVETLVLALLILPVLAIYFIYRRREQLERT